MTQTERAVGAMIGFAVGDALGATTEFMSPDDIRDEIGIHSEITGGGWLELEPGQVTDDTEMLLCVAESLIYCKCFDDIDMANRCVEWMRSGPVDIGNTIRLGLNRYARTGILEVEPDPRQAGNGALMRVLPMMLSGQSYGDILRHAHLTHNCVESDDIITEMYDLLFSIMQCDGDEVPKSPVGYCGKSGGYVVETWNTVMHCLTTTADSFEEALVKCANMGGDADTTCAILGALMGAMHGPGGIPERWTDKMQPRLVNQLRSYAELLTEMGW